MMGNWDSAYKNTKKFGIEHRSRDIAIPREARVFIVRWETLFAFGSKPWKNRTLWLNPSFVNGNTKSSAMNIERIKTFPTDQVSQFFLNETKSYTRFSRRIYEEFCYIHDLEEKVNFRSTHLHIWPCTRVLIVHTRTHHAPKHTPTRHLYAHTPHTRVPHPRPTCTCHTRAHTCPHAPARERTRPMANTHAPRSYTHLDLNGHTYAKVHHASARTHHVLCTHVQCVYVGVVHKWWVQRKINPYKCMYKKNPQ